MCEPIGIRIFRKEIAELKDKLLSGPDNEELQDSLFEKLNELEELGYEDVQ